MSGNDSIFEKEQKIYSIENREADRIEVRRQTEEFLAKGGKVNYYDIMQRQSNVFTKRQLKVIEESLEKGFSLSSIAYHLRVSVKVLENSKAVKNIKRGLLKRKKK